MPAILRNKTSILTPHEYSKLRKVLPAKYICICDVLLNTGMRIEEFWDFLQHPEWFSAARRCIELPTGAIKKERSVYKERTIRLTIEGCDAVKTLFGMNGSITQMTREGMRMMLRRCAETAGIGTQGISPKMFRKTAVSWLLTCFPEKMFQIEASMGHDWQTMKRHYVNLAFEKRDVEEMREFFQGWGEA